MVIGRRRLFGSVVSGRYHSSVPLYKEQGIVLRSIKLGEADKIVTILTQGSGKIRAVAKGIRKTRSRFGARLEPFTHVSLLLYRGRSLDTVTQAEILGPFTTVRGSFGLIAAGETMVESADKVAEEHERNVRLFLLLLSGLRSLERRPNDPAAVAEAFLLPGVVGPAAGSAVLLTARLGEQLDELGQPRGQGRRVRGEGVQGLRIPPLPTGGKEKGRRPRGSPPRQSGAEWRACRASR